ncbi:3-hydroxyisobutyryl-CoA hydrolase, mitochondrial-like [Eupeodes corollae]|uniref:3-hydroxyisobutyryl-CoA hydrolase, mitochondrial-like n=1 Tax=Eupeodes corollae TaxID=290404 RepID=UPI0024934D4B|nr:3-hydroxyisobutyryl-CoA hydrolase, mitochondrial-like [Eupeodes corollae]
MMLWNDITRTILPALRNNGNSLALLRSLTSSSTSESIQINETKHSATIVLNRPKVLNAMNMDMVLKIQAQLTKFEESKSLVIVKGSGGKSFSVGGDISSLLKAGLEESRIFFRKVYTLLYFIANKKVPNIALIDGVTMGGGFGLAVHGKYCIATERTVLAMPETAIGLFPDVGSSCFLNRLNGKLGLYLGMTGSRLMGEDIARVGLATHFCKSSQLPALEAELLNANHSNEVPKILNEFSLKLEPKEEGISLLMAKINANFNVKTVEDIFKNLEKDDSEWALKTLASLKEKCPLSLKLTFRQMQLGVNLPLDECLKMEYRMASRCLGNDDFKEGVRALLIDKDKNPAWKPATLEAVTDEYVATFFARLPENQELKL